jgi:hypothetical protein
VDGLERLHKTCRRLIWLNPLLRWEGCAPLAAGSRAIIKHVDDFRAVHNLQSLGNLTGMLATSPPPPGTPHNLAGHGAGGEDRRGSRLDPGAADDLPRRFHTRKKQLLVDSAVSPW